MAETALETRIWRPTEHHDDARGSSPEVDWESVPCPLCDAQDHVAVIETPDYLTQLGGTIRVVRCRVCGLAYTNPRPTPASIGQFYPANYAPHEGHDRDAGWRGKLRQYLERCILRRDFGYPPQPTGVSTAVAATVGRTWIRSRRRRAAWIPFRGTGRLLDFGCGAAQFIRRMKELGWFVEGVETSRSVADRVSREVGVRVHVGSLPHPDVALASFDVVTMWSSLEHVHRPREVVQAARRALKPGGLLVVSVPNFASWSASRFGRAWLGLDLPRHLVHFTPATLRELLERERFAVRQLNHVARDGWLRHSARHAIELSVGPAALRACCWKPFSLAVSGWTARTNQADCIVALAELC